MPAVRKADLAVVGAGAAPPRLVVPPGEVVITVRADFTGYRFGGLTEAFNDIACLQRHYDLGVCKDQVVVLPSGLRLDQAAWNRVQAVRPRVLTNR